MEPGSGGEGAAAGEDRLSALPDDVVVLILLKLSTEAAAQTRVLSHRWRHLWALLPSLSFLSAPEPHRLRDALDDHQVLLRTLVVGTTPECLAVWLPAAARRVAGLLTVIIYLDNEEEEVEDAQRGVIEFPCFNKAGVIEFPCFNKATKIWFFLYYQALAIPDTGVFARLTELHLKRLWFHGPGELGDAVSSPRCPSLQRLTIEDARGLSDLAIHSVSMLSIKLINLRTLSQLNVVAPGLKELIMKSCFVNNPPVANISAPLLTELEWDDKYDLSSVHLGKMACVQCLCVERYLVYGWFDAMHNGSCLSLLKHFEAIKDLSLTLLFPRDIEDFDYLMQDMAVLPDIAFLCLKVISNRHAFGASGFHVLRLCTGIRSLKLELANTASEAESKCSSDCICVELVEWETEELLLNRLEKVEIVGWSGTEHEVAFVKHLFDWGTKLKEMTVNLIDSYDPISEVKVKELYQTFQSFSRPGVCMKFYRYENHLPELYAPKD